MINMREYEDNAISGGHKYICGVDEVGRGCLAGPVVSAAVILNLDENIRGINDSKQLSAKKRNSLYQKISTTALAISVSVVDVETIDKVNIYNATKLAMNDAIVKLSIKPDILLIDAMKLHSGINEISIIKGDSKSISIAAASIIAKVYRDNMMTEYAKEYPEYGFEKHKGYGTAVHLKAIEKHGITDIHRKTFKPVAVYLKDEQSNLF